MATVDAELTKDCREGFYSNETLNGNSTQVRCLEAGWWVVHPCVRGEGTLITCCLQKEYFENVNKLSV